MAVTIKQVAAAAGVSRGTVDRVLHNRGGVRQEVAEHIQEVAARMGYFPNRAGRMLAARKQPITLGYVIPTIGNPFFEDVKKGIHLAELEYRDFGLNIILTEVRGFYQDAHIRAIEQTLEQGCSALCVTTLDTPALRKRIDAIIAGGTPVITMNTDLTDTQRLCYVGSDYVVAGRTAAGLLSLYDLPQTQELLVATGSLEVKGHNDRIYGFQSVLEKKKVPFHLLSVYETQDDEDIAFQKTCDMFERYPDVNCVFITGGGTQGVCRAIEQLPKKQRKSLRVMCFDDYEPIRRYVKKGIIDFVVCQEPLEQGYQSVLKLFNYFIDGGHGAMSNHITKAVIKINENLEKR